MARVVDHHADRAIYKQLADILREQIRTGELAPGAMLPSEPRLCQIHEVGRETVRRGLDILRAEGLVSSTRGVGTEVREQPPRRDVVVRAGTRAWLGFADGVPVLVVDQGDGEVAHPGDRTTIVFPAGES
jgi:GntR family transcriptional regulator